MNALILAAGFCTRLFPITEYFPKALLTVDGKPILEYLLTDLLKTKGIERVVCITNQRYYPIFSTYLVTYYRDNTIELLNNNVTSPQTKLGAIGDLLFAFNTLHWNDDIMVLASDTLASLKLKNFLTFFQKHHGVVNTVFDTKNPDTIRAKLGCVELEGEKIIRFIEKPDHPATTLTSIPYYIFPKDILPLLHRYPHTGLSMDAPGSIITWLAGQTDCYAYNIGHGFYFDVGTIDIYNRLASHPELLSSKAREKKS
jgi:glucose-1-phosphate thymidylyltransferase